MEQPKDQNYIKISNTNLLLNFILEKHPVSRTDLSRLSGISPTSITRIVSGLISLGLVHEIGDDDFVSGSVGRKAVLLDVIPSSLYTVGVQVGIKDITVCILDLASSVVASVTEKHVLEGLSLKELAGTCLSVYQKAVMTNKINPLKILGMCIGFSALTDPLKGELVLSAQFRWGEENIIEEFQNLFCLPAAIENDEKACLIGETHLRGLEDSRNLAVISFGAGVGCAATSEGYLIRGGHNGAGEIGHIIVDGQGGMECICGRRGCLHTHIAIPYLLARARKFKPDIGSVQDLRSAFDSNQEWAVKLMEDCVEHIRMSLEIIWAMYSSDKIIIFGVLFEYFGDVLPQMILDAMSVPLLGDSKDRILFSLRNNQSCSIGCAHIARKTFIKKYLEEQL